MDKKLRIASGNSLSTLWQKQAIGKVEGGLAMEPDDPARPWQELAEKTAHEQDPKKVVELAKALIRAFDEQQSSGPRKSNTPKRGA